MMLILILCFKLTNYKKKTSLSNYNTEQSIY